MAATLLGQSGPSSVTYTGGETVLVVVAGFGNVTTPFTCSDGTNTYTVLVEFDDAPSGGGWFFGLFKADNVTAGTYTVTTSPADTTRTRVYRYSGLASGAVQAAGFLRFSGTSTPDGPTLTASSQPALLFVAAIKQNAGTDWGPNPSYNDLGAFASDQMWAQSLDLTATGSYTPNWVASGGAAFEDFFTGAAIISESGGGGTNYNVAISEIGTGSDTNASRRGAAAAISETATASHTQAARAALRAALTETATATDTQALRGALRVAISETATASETYATVAAGAFSVAVSETATAAHTQSARTALRATIAEVAQALDQITTRYAVRASVQESAVALEVALGAARWRAIILEAAQALDDPRVNRDWDSSVSEAVSAQDLPRTNRNWDADVEETAQALAFYIGALLWNPVDDSQSPNWQNVVDTQTPGWTSVVDAQTPGWQDI